MCVFCKSFKCCNMTRTYKLDPANPLVRDDLVRGLHTFSRGLREIMPNNSNWFYFQSVSYNVDIYFIKRNIWTLCNILKVVEKIVSLMKCSSLVFSKMGLVSPVGSMKARMPKMLLTV